MYENKGNINIPKPFLGLYNQIFILHIWVVEKFILKVFSVPIMATVDPNPNLSTGNE